MINRILIRMKVVQMLYSYLLTRSDFKILPEPESHSRDKRFAYSLYCDLLLLLLDQSGYRISNYEGRPRIEPANKIGKNDWTHIAAALAANDDMKDIALHHRSFSEALLPHHQRLSAAIKESSAFKDYSRMKTKPEIQDEVQLWKTIFTTILLRDNAIKELINSDPDSPMWVTSRLSRCSMKRSTTFRLCAARLWRPEEVLPHRSTRPTNYITACCS